VIELKHFADDSQPAPFLGYSPTHIVIAFAENSQVVVLAVKEFIGRVVLVEEGDGQTFQRSKLLSFG